MGILHRLQENKQTPSQTPAEQLTQQELGFLLNTLKSTPLVGDQVEMFYILVVKLQNQYLALAEEN
jgi:hypothetical protein